MPNRSANFGRLKSRRSRNWRRRLRHSSLSRGIVGLLCAICFFMVGSFGGYPKAATASTLWRCKLHWSRLGIPARKPVPCHLPAPHSGSNGLAGICRASRLRAVTAQSRLLKSELSRIWRERSQSILAVLEKEALATALSGKRQTRVRPRGGGSVLSGSASGGGLVGYGQGAGWR